MPATGKLLLDTSVIIDLFAGDVAVQRALADADEVFIPGVALGELLYGARRSARPEQNLAQVEAFAAISTVLACDAETARRYGEIKN